MLNKFIPIIMALVFFPHSGMCMDMPLATKKVCLGGTCVACEVADNDASRSRGLMYRDSLKPGTGMLFIFPEEGRYSFWMKNMRFALDMLWISTNGEITSIMADVPPCGDGDCPGLEPRAQARYVLEVESGFCAKHGLTTGQRVEIGE